MYRVLAYTHVIPHNHIIWKLKLPPKIKKFMWYMIKGVTLAKDNLAKRRCKGSIKCCFCNYNETIQHLFFDYPNAKLIWRAIQISFDIPQRVNVFHMFNGWLYEYNDNKLIFQSLVGASAIYWAIWLSRNDVIFNNVRTPSSLEVTLRGTHWICFWALLQ